MQSGGSAKELIGPRLIRPWLLLLAGALCLMAGAIGCQPKSIDENYCFPVEDLAFADSLSILNTAHAGGELRVRIVGFAGICYSHLRVESASRGDTVVLRPIAVGLSCPLSPCTGGFGYFAETVGVPAKRPGPMWVRVEVRRGRLVDSTVVLPAESRAS
jgi:hypothetical protein